jgi:hypothetical protein
LLAAGERTEAENPEAYSEENIGFGPGEEMNAPDFSTPEGEHSVYEAAPEMQTVTEASYDYGADQSYEQYAFGPDENISTSGEEQYSVYDANGNSEIVPTETGRSLEEISPEQRTEGPQGQTVGDGETDTVNSPEAAAPGDWGETPPVLEGTGETGNTAFDAADVGESSSDSEPSAAAPPSASGWPSSSFEPPPSPPPSPEPGPKTVKEAVTGFVNRMVNIVAPRKGTGAVTGGTITRSGVGSELTNSVKRSDAVCLL